MEFELDIDTKQCGEITITDYSRDYGLYYDEDTIIKTEFDSYKYSHTTTINAIMKVTPDIATLIDVILTNHDPDKIESATFHIKKDGYYIVDHLILPNKIWYDEMSGLYDSELNYLDIYITDGGKVYKEVEGLLEECELKEILERNPEGTTIQRCKVDVFYTGHLQECYIGWCKKVFDDLLNKCKPNQYNDDVWARDFVWMTLNIIDYLVGFKLYLEAYRILTEASTCGGFCAKDKELHYKGGGSGCGCSKA